MAAFFHTYTAALPFAARGVVFALLCLLTLPMVGCAERSPVADLPFVGDGAAEIKVRAEALLARDPAGAVPAPQIPPQLKAPATPPAPTRNGTILYTVDYSSPDAPELADAFGKTATLSRLLDSPPDSLTGLEQRLSVSLNEARDVLHSYGYYAGTVDGHIAPPGSGTGPSKDGDKAVVRVIFTPGPRYTMGRTEVAAFNRNAVAGANAAPGATPSATGSSEAGAGPPATGSIGGKAADGTGSKRAKTDTPPEAGTQAVHGPGLPVTLADVGLAPGSPAAADAVLDAVERTTTAFHNHGYPFAKVEATRYIVDHRSRTLEADVRIDAGAFARMGDIRVQGESPVTLDYLESMRTWTPGAPWNQEAVDALSDSLRNSGLMRSINLTPAETADAGGQRDVVAALEPAPPRTVGWAIKYDSDFGPGVQGDWEHRNFTGRGDDLLISMPLWTDMQEITARYRLPYFLRKDQTFIAQAGLLNEDTDAYNLRSAAASAGVERRFGPYWVGNLQGSAEGGQVKDPHEPRRRYILLGIPASLAYDDTGSLLDSVKGVRASLAATPYTGTYFENFSVLRARLDAQAFYPLVGQDTLVMALRGSYGSLWGANAPQVPPSVRFYSGGGGSVRGYAYQSLGPRDDDNNPLGGTSLLECSLEPRWKITPEWGVVAFVDGGMAYDDTVQSFGSNLRWGAGVGLRYYTAIGPVRFDLATPLNPRSDDAPMQFYISIGQSF